MKLTSAAVLLLLLCPLSVTAQTTVYAVYGMELTNERGDFKTVNVGLLPSGKISDCKNQIEMYERAVRRTASQALKLLQSKCVFTLPGDLQPIIDEKRLPDAYVLKQSKSGKWAPIYSAWYGLPSNAPKEICSKIIAGMRRIVTAEQAEIKCSPPLIFDRAK